jgi:hypothetical protein
MVVVAVAEQCVQVPALIFGAQGGACCVALALPGVEGADGALQGAVGRA